MVCRIFFLLVTITLLFNINQTWSRNAKYWIGIDPNHQQMYYVDNSMNPWTPSQYFSFQPSPISQALFEGRSGINRLQQTNINPLDDIGDQDYFTTIQSNIGDTTEDKGTRLPIYHRQFRPQGIFSFLNPRPGPPGPPGPQGSRGPQGSQGNQGPRGNIGPAGPVGATGPAGPPGADGAIGPPGADGAIGPPGADGAIGPTGADGAIGPTGADGAIGPTGADGAIGPAGPPGADGATGPAGPPGADGATG